MQSWLIRSSGFLGADAQPDTREMRERGGAARGQAARPPYLDEARDPGVFQRYGLGHGRGGGLRMSARMSQSGLAHVIARTADRLSSSFPPSLA
jgi:hypothetical protein